MALIVLFALFGFTYAIPPNFTIRKDCTPLLMRDGTGTVENFPHFGDSSKFFPSLKLGAIDGNAWLLYDIFKEKSLNETLNTINSIDSERMTPLHWASLLGRVEAVRVLLCFGADVHQLDKDSNTALHFAALSDNPDTIRLLVPFGGRINGKNAGNKTPLHLAIEEGEFPVVKTLMEFGADTHIKDGKGRLPLDLAISKGNKAIIKLLKSVAEEQETVEQKPYHWVTEAKKINPVIGGNDVYCQEVYVGRVHFNSEVLPAKVCSRASRAYAAYNGTELTISSYEILDSINVAWKPFNNNHKIPLDAIVGGRSQDGEPYYIGRANIIDEGIPYLTPGKVSSDDKLLYATFGQKEYIFTKFEILVLHV